MNKIKTKLSVILGLAIFNTNAMAQGIADVIKMYNYGRYENVKTLTASTAATNADANYYQGLSELGLGNIDAAKALFAKFPTDPANIAGLARVMFVQKNKDGAMALLNGMVAKAKKKDYLPLKFAADALTYSEGADQMKAVEWYKKAIEIKQDADLYTGLGDAYYNLPSGGGDAFRNWEEALAKKADAGGIYFRLGDLWYSAKNYDTALAYYKRCNDADPNNPLPYNSLANSYYKLNKYELAKQNIKKYLELSDNSLQDQLKYANILFLSKDYAGTVAKMNELLGKGVDKPYMHRLLGFCNYELGNNEVALKEMETFFEKQDKSKILAPDYSYYAKILSKTAGKEAMASEYFEKSINADTTADKSETYREVAEMYKNNKDWATASKWYINLIDKNPNALQALDYYWAGFTGYYNKDYANASKYFNIMTVNYPKEPSGYYWLGRTSAAVDDKAITGTGVAPYQKYLELVGETNAEKKQDITKALTYITQYYYNKKDATNAVLNANKLITIDGANTYGPQIINFFKKGGATKATTTTTTTTTTSTTPATTTTKPVKKK
jgi:tetratricopeptide (TPR) repeat protein